MNHGEIEFMHANAHACPNVRKGVRLLYNLMLAVNAQSDGWCYWPAPRKSAERLMDLLGTAGNTYHDTYGTITESDLKKAISPIRRMVTYQREKQKQYGNTFDFDVDAAMKADTVIPVSENSHADSMHL